MAEGVLRVKSFSGESHAIQLRRRKSALLQNGFHGPFGVRIVVLLPGKPLLAYAGCDLPVYHHSRSRAVFPYNRKEVHTLLASPLAQHQRVYVGIALKTKNTADLLFKPTENRPGLAKTM